MTALHGGSIRRSPHIDWAWDGGRAAATPVNRIECIAWFGTLANRQEIYRRVGRRDFHDDGECVACTFEVLGDDAWTALEGQFAVLLRDHRHDTLIGVTDTIGSVGIHYRESPGTLSISFDIERLLRDRPGDDARINTDAIALLLCGLGPMPEETYFTDVKRVPPATCATFSAQGTRSRRYWDPVDSFDTNLEFDGLPDAFAALMTTVCTGYADGRHPSLLLSGGLDSALVAWALCQDSAHGPTALSTRAIGDVEPAEIECAQATARHLGLESFTVDYPVDSLFDPDRGLCCGPGYPVYGHHFLADRIHATARDHGLDTLFTGDGGDHLFCKPECAIADLLARGRWRTAVRDARTLARTRRQHPFAPLSAAARLVLRAARPFVRAAHCPTVPFATDRMKRRARHLRRARQPNPSRRDLPGRWQHHARLMNPNLDFLLQARVGRSMSSGIAYRYPLLDRRIVTFLAAVGTRRLAGNGRTKRLFRDCLKHRLPTMVTDRPKALFTHHFAQALRRQPQGVRALTRSTRLADTGWIDARAYGEAVDDWLQKPHAPMPPMFLGLLALEDWLRRHF